MPEDLLSHSNGEVSKQLSTANHQHYPPFANWKHTNCRYDVTSFPPSSSSHSSSIISPHPSPPPIPGSPVAMPVTRETTYQRRVCVRTAILCVNSVWAPGPPTVPLAETQGDIQSVPFSCDTRPIGREALRGFERTPLLASKRFYTLPTPTVFKRYNVASIEHHHCPSKCGCSYASCLSIEDQRMNTECTHKHVERR